MPISRKSKRPGLKTCRNRNRKRQRGGELALMSKYAYNEDAFDAIKQRFLDLVVVELKYLNRDVFFEDIKPYFKTICSDNEFITELDTLMSHLNDNDSNINFNAENDIIDHIAMNTGETSINIAAIVLLNDKSNTDRLYRIDSEVRHIIFEFLSALPEFNQRRAEQRKNAYVGLQGQGGLPANAAREVASYL